MLSKIVIFLLVIINLMAMYITYDVVKNFESPRAYNQDTVLEISKNVPVGGELFIKRRVKNEINGCISHVYRYVAPLNDMGSKIFIGEYNRPTEPSEKEVILNLAIDMPEFLPPGEYVYFNKIEYYCNIINYIFKPYVYEAPPVHFTIVPK